MTIVFSKLAHEEYEFWKMNDPRKTERIRTLLIEIQKTPFSGIGKPEPLKFQLSGYWSRRIDKEHRLVYRINKGGIEVVSCRYHYA